LKNRAENKTLTKFWEIQTSQAIKRRISTEKRLKAHTTIFNLSAVVIITH
jgi:hypothetical protein